MRPARASFTVGIVGSVETARNTEIRVALLELLRRLREAHPEVPLKILCGGDDGVNSCAADVAREIGIEVIALEQLGSRPASDLSRRTVLEAFVASHSGLVVSPASLCPGRKVTWPRELRTTLRRLSEYNEDLRRFAARIADEGEALPMPATPPPRPLAYLDRLFTATDWLGSYYRRCFTRALKVRYGLWAAMAFLLITFKKDSEGALALAAILGVLVVFSLGTLFARWAHRRAWHRKYLDYRALAEAIRVEFFWEAAGIRRGIEGEFAHESFLQEQDADLHWIRCAMRSVSLELALEESTETVAALPFVGACWVGDERTGGGQTAYYRERLRRLAHSLHAFERFDRILLVGGLALALAFALDVAMRSAGMALLAPHLRSGMLWCLALIPVYAAIVEIYVSEKGDRTLVRQYRYMHRLFSGAAAELRGETSEARQIDVLRTLGRACLAEHAQWILAHRDKRIQGMRW
jgi:hypothetical protein